MGFISITTDKFIELHLKRNPSENRNDLSKRLNQTLTDFENGVKCACGNDIWVIGSAFVGNSCFTCITGESIPVDDYEIDLVLKKHKNHNKNT